MKLFLLDGYALIYRAYYGLIKNPRINSRGEDMSAVFGFARTLQEVMSRERPTHLGVAFDPHGGTFRHEQYPAYKAQRDVTPEGIRIAVPIIKEMLGAQGVPVLEVAGYEADDVIGTLARKADEAGVETYMVTPDKDYGQLVTERVRMYRPRSRGGGFDVEGPAEVCARWGLQRPSQVVDLLALMGDKSDNIPGCPGVGETRAVELIGRFGSVEGLIEHVDELKGAMQKRVADNVEQIRLSRWLAEIVTTVPIDLDLKALAVQPLTPTQAATLRDLYLRYEMRSLLKDIPSAEPAPKADGMMLPFAEDAVATPAAPLKSDSQAVEMGLLPFADDAASALPSPLVEESLYTDIESFTAAVTAFYARTPMEKPLAGLAVDAAGGELHVSVALSDTVAATLTVTASEAQEALRQTAATLDGISGLTLGVHDFKPVVKQLREHGVELKTAVRDTMIAHYLLHPEQTHQIGRLEETLSGVPTSARDAALTSTAKAATSARRLLPLLTQQLETEGMKQLYEDVEMPLVSVLADMEMAGIRLDSEALAAASKAMGERVARLEKEIHRLAGMEFNIASPRQVGDVLFQHLQLATKAKRTKTGVYSTSEEVLLPLKHKHPIVELILDYRAAQKLRSTYLDALPRLADAKTGRIHTQLNQTVTATGRLSSSNPNLQNIPVRTEEGRDIRGAFVADEGELFFAADYSQIELRLMAHLSGDESLIEDFRQGHDIHAATAAKIFHKSIEEVSRHERSRAKTANFGIIYGITAFGLAERLDIARSEAKELIAGYFATYPQVHAYMQESIDRARSMGYAVTLMGRRCRVDGIASANATVRALAERIAINAPIQGSAADIIKLAMVRIDSRMKALRLRSRMLLQVHDELIFSVVPEEREVVEQIVVREMEGAASLRVPLVASTGWGHSWKDAH